MPRTGPIGNRRTRAALPAAAGSVSSRWNSPLKRRASSAAHRKVEATRCVSARAHMSGLPFSAVMSRAISSARCVTLVETCMSASARTAAGWAAVSWRAAQAAATRLLDLIRGRDGVATHDGAVVRVDDVGDDVTGRRPSGDPERQGGKGRTRAAWGATIPGSGHRWRSSIVSPTTKSGTLGATSLRIAVLLRPRQSTIPQRRGIASALRTTYPVPGPSPLVAPRENRMSIDVAVTTGGPTLPQERRLVTAIPGPRSIELQERRTAGRVGGRRRHPAGVHRRGRRRRAGRRRRQLPDRHGLRHRRDHRGQLGTRRSWRTCSARWPSSPTPASWSRPTSPTSQVCEALNELTPGDHVKRSALFNSGAEAVENAVKIARAYTHRQAIVVFEHGYHGRTNLTMGLTAKNMPYKHSFGPFAPEIYRVPLSYPFRDGPHRRGGRSPRHQPDRQGDRRGQRRRDHHRADRRARAASSSRPRASCPRSSSSPAPTASCSSPTRSRPASAAPATGSPATTRASSRT